MGTARFERGAIVEINNQKCCLSRKISDAWQLEDVRTGRISELQDSQLLAMYANGKLRFETKGVTHPCIKAPTQVSEAAKLRRLYVVAALKASSVQDLDQAITDVWEKMRKPARPPGRVSVYRWTKRFLDSGSDIRSLEYIPHRGNRSLRVPAEVMDICEQAINAVYMRRERKHLQDALDHAIVRVQEENQLRPATTALPPPTRRLFRRLIEDIPAFDRYAARYGHDAALRHFRSVGQKRVAHEPLERAEIDHTRLDLFVVDDETLLPLGRPWLTACQDDYSRCILGLFLGFTPPSFLSVSLCLKDAFRPKTWLKESCPEIQSDWPCYGVMRELVLDNGPEFHSDSLEQACLMNGIEMHYAPRRTPWFKGKIERFFRTLNEGVTHGVPGTSFSNILDKGDYEPTKHAIITFSTLKKLVRKWIADVYHQKPHRVLGISPAQMWSSSIRPEDISVPDDPAALDLTMGRRFVRILTHKGIEFQGLYYNSPELHDLRLRRGSVLEVEIRVDESDLGHIFVLSPGTGQAVEVPALNKHYASGIGLFQHRVIRRYQKRSALEPSTDGWLRAKQEIAEIIARETRLKPKRSRQRVARWEENLSPKRQISSREEPVAGSGHLIASKVPNEACVTPEPLQASTAGVKDLPFTILEKSRGE